MPEKKDFSLLSQVHMQALLFDGIDVPLSAKKSHILYSLPLYSILSWHLGQQISQK